MGENPGIKWPGETQGHEKPDFKFWQIVAPPPSRKEVMKWIEEQKKDTDTDVRGDPGELDQFSQVGLKHIMETIIILRVWCSLMARPRQINMGGSIPKNKSPVMSNRNCNP